LDAKLNNLTNGACKVFTGSASRTAEVDAIIIAGRRPDYTKLAEELTRLARWTPGKKFGYIVATAHVRTHVVSAWRAMAIEDLRVEEAISRASVAFGKKGDKLKWEQIPQDLRRLFDGRRPQEEAEVAVARGVEDLSDRWDVWFGRLSAWKAMHNAVIQPRKRSEIHGYNLGEWMDEQRSLWDSGYLGERKAARLKSVGVLLDYETESFVIGLQELRKYVVREWTRVVPWSYKTESGFPLGKWVVKQRTMQRRLKLSPRRVELLKEAFFLFQPSEAPSMMFDHDEDEEVAEVTRTIETELRTSRWQPQKERRRKFRLMVLKYHPDIWPDERAGPVMQFLADVKVWFLSAY